MPVSDAYLTQTKNLRAILDAVRQAQPPDRFTHKFLEQLDFRSTNDRPIIGVLKSLGFIDESGAPKQPYFDFMDDEQHKAVLAEGIRRAYADLFKLNNRAHERETGWVKNKLKILTQGGKSDAVLTKMAMTFVALSKEADFSIAPIAQKESRSEAVEESSTPPTPNSNLETSGSRHKQHQFALSYHINIELPAVRDQAIYDAIFRSLRDNLL